jgi:hypothetical protein
LLAAGLVPAQDQPDPGARGQQEPTFEAPSIFSQKSVFSSFDISDTTSDAQLPAPIYQGPLSPITKGVMTAFGLYAQIIGVYDSGLLSVSAMQGKQVSPVGSYGEETNFGANASHRFRRGKLGIEYRGSYRKYTAAPTFDGLDQFLQLAYGGMLAEHLTLDMKTTLGTTTLANGAFSYFPLASLDRLGLPTDELFDSRTNYLQSRTDLTWQETARLSFDLGGDGFVVRRASPLLAGLSGYSARASVAYRLTPRQTISATYDNTNFDFQRAFGNSRLQTTVLGYSVALTRQWDLSTLAGSVRVDTLGLEQVALDPAITALVGQSFAFVTFTNTLYLPMAEVRLIRRGKADSMTFDYSSGVTPGNGLYLTSRQTSGAFTYSYAASRKLEARASAGYNQLSALGQTLGKYSNLQGGMQVLYRLTSDAYLDVRYDYRHYTSGLFTAGDALLQKDSNRVSLGVAFSLGETSPVTW